MNSETSSSSTSSYTDENYTVSASKSTENQLHGDNGTGFGVGIGIGRKIIFKKGDLVKLNVGGKIFQTTWDTLTKECNSMLSAMFAGQFPIQLDENGCVFIDRDGKHFKKVLNFLRNGSLELPNERSQCHDLLKEAEYYQITAMAQYLQEGLIEYDEGGLNNYYRSIRSLPKTGKQVTVIKNESERDALIKNTADPMVILEVSSSSFGEEKDAIIYKHLVLFDKLSSDYGDKILFVKQIVYTGKEWKFYAKGKLQHSIFFYNQYNGKHSFQEEIILDRILKLFLLK